MSFGSRNPRSRTTRFIIHILALLAATPAFGQIVLRPQVYHPLTTCTNDGVRAWGHTCALSAEGSKIAFPRQFCGTSRSNVVVVCTMDFDASGLTLVEQWASGPTVQVGINPTNEHRRFYRSVQLP